MCDCRNKGKKKKGAEITQKRERETEHRSRTIFSLVEENKYSSDFGALISFFFFFHLLEEKGKTERNILRKGTKKKKKK